jgi:hypothetical protein
MITGLTAADILPAAESLPGTNTNNFTGLDMSKRKHRYQSIDERSWGSLEAHDKAQREQDVAAWKKNSESLPENAFADDVPDDLDRDGYVSRNVTHVASQSVLEE